MANLAVMTALCKCDKGSPGALAPLMTSMVPGVKIAGKCVGTVSDVHFLGTFGQCAVTKLPCTYSPGGSWTSIVSSVFFGDLLPLLLGSQLLCAVSGLIELVELAEGSVIIGGRLYLIKKGVAYDNGVRIDDIDLVTIDGFPVEVSTAKAFLEMLEEAKKDGVDLKLESGFRTNKRQKELYDQWKRGEGNRAAPPGYLNHQDGQALDIVMGPGVEEWLNRNGGRHGFERTVPSENWHWERKEEVVGRGDGARGDVDTRILPTVDGS